MMTAAATTSSTTMSTTHLMYFMESSCKIQYHRRRTDEGQRALPRPEETPHVSTKHEGETFLNQTVYISGQAFIRCNFVACTLVLRETVHHLEGCTFERLQLACGLGADVGAARSRCARSSRWWK